MNRVSINLATRPFRNNAPYWLGFGACFVLLLAFSWYNVHAYFAASRDLVVWSEKVAAQKAELDGISADVASMTGDVRQVDLRTLSERSAFANGIILSRLFSWTELFDRLEGVLPENVRLRSIRPAVSAEEIQVSVDGAAKDYAALLRFEENLIDSDFFTFVYPQMETAKEGQPEIQFHLSFGYAPAGRQALAGAAAPGAAPSGAPAPAPAEAGSPPGALPAGAGAGEDDVADDGETEGGEDPDSPGEEPPSPDEEAP